VLDRIVGREERLRKGGVGKRDEVYIAEPFNVACPLMRVEWRRSQGRDSNAK
jgi:hypothetical protein